MVPASDEVWIRRCFDLARMGLGHVSPNPPVGAVLVHDGQWLAEGYHARFGGWHAEVMAIHHVPAAKRHLIPQATLYVSLEPCCITGKTPACTDLILGEGIRDVRVSAIDPNPRIAGKGLEILTRHGIRTTAGILKEEGESLIRSFTTNVVKQRPHIILKWAQSQFGIAGEPGRQVWFSHPQTQVFTHRLRAEADAILVGARTVETDDPSLTTRHYPGRSPHRVVYDPNGRLRQTYAVFREDGCLVYYFSKVDNPGIRGDHIRPVLLDDATPHVNQIIRCLFDQQIGNLLVEGGAYLQKCFIRENLWDEAWVIQTPQPQDKGIAAPVVKGRLIRQEPCGPDWIIGMTNVDSPGISS